MAKIKSFNARVLKELRSDINSELVKLEKKLGVKMSAGSATYSDGSATFKLECVVSAGKNGLSVSEIKYKNNLKQYGSLFDLDMTQLGKIFKWRDGKTFIFIGVAPNRRRYPIVGENTENGNIVLFTDDTAPDLIKKSKRYSSKYSNKRG